MKSPEITFSPPSETLITEKSARAKEKESNPFLRKAVLALTAGLALLEASNAFAGENKPVNLQVGTKIENMSSYANNGTVTNIDRNGIVSVATDSGKSIELRPTDKNNIFELDFSGSKLPDAAVDLSTGDLKVLYDYSLLDEKINTFSVYLDKTTQEEIAKTPFSERNLNFYQKIDQQLKKIDKLKISSPEHSSSFTVQLIDSNGKKVVETFDLPNGYKVTELEQADSYPGNTSLIISSQNKRYEVEVTVDNTGKIIFDNFSNKGGQSFLNNLTPTK